MQYIGSEVREFAEMLSYYPDGLTGEEITEILGNEWEESAERL